MARRVVGSNQYKIRRNEPLAAASNLVIQAAHLDTRVGSFLRCGEVWGTQCRAWVHAPHFRHGDHPGSPTRLRRHPDPGQLIDLVGAAALTPPQITQLLRNSHTQLEHVLALMEGGQTNMVLDILGKTWDDNPKLGHHPRQWTPAQWDKALSRWPVDASDYLVITRIGRWAANHHEVLVHMWRNDRWQPAVPFLLIEQIPPEVQDEALQRTLMCTPSVQQWLDNRRIQWNHQRMLIWAQGVDPQAAVPALDNDAIPLDDVTLDILVSRCSANPRAAGALGGALARRGDMQRMQQLWDNTPLWHSDRLDRQWRNSLQQMCRNLVVPPKALAQCVVQVILSGRGSLHDFYMPWARRPEKEQECPSQVLMAAYDNPETRRRLTGLDRSAIIGLPWCPPQVLECEAQIPAPSLHDTVIRDNLDLVTVLPWYQALQHPNCPLPVLLRAIHSPHLSYWSAAAQMLDHHPRIPEEYKALARLAR